jgi:hypothetical protein
MATAMPAIDWEQEQEQDTFTPESCEDTAPTSSGRLLQSQRQELETEIRRAKSIPEIHGPEGLYSQETLDRAVAFLRMHVERLWRSYGVRAPIPAIGPGPDGSVDIFWELAPWQLLVNIPANPNALATFYGHDQRQQKTKGSVDSNTFSFSIAACLMT